MLAKVLSRYLFISIFFLSIFIFFAHTTYTKTAVFSDGRFYYAITRSITFDFDLKFSNEFEVLGVTPTYTHSDFAWNKYPPGAPILWAPLFYIFSGLAVVLNILGINLGADGFGVVYEASVAITSIFLGTLGFYLIYRLLKDYFSEIVSLLSVFTLFAATNLLFYIAVEPINSHAASFFAASLFVFYFLKYEKSKHYYFILGLLAGIAGVIRTQDLLILILPVFKILKYKKPVSGFIKIITGVFIAFIPQIFFWKRIFNSYLYSPYLEEGFNLFDPYITHVLLNNKNGLFILTPIIAVSLLGLFIFAKKSKTLAIYGIAYFLVQLYLVSAWSGFSQGGSYSVRMMVSTYPLLSFGLASVINLLRKKVGVTFTLTAIILFALLNSALIIRYLLIY